MFSGETPENINPHRFQRKITKELDVFLFGKSEISIPKSEIEDLCHL